MATRPSAQKSPLALEQDEEHDTDDRPAEADRRRNVHPPGQVDEKKTEEEAGHEEQHSGRELDRLVDQDAGDAFRQGRVSPDQESPGGVASDAGRGDERVERVADDLGPEEAQERHRPEMGGLDEAPSAGLDEEPGEGKGDGGREPRAEPGQLGEDRPRADLQNEIGQKEESRAAQEQPGRPPSRTGRACPTRRAAGHAPGDRRLGLLQRGFVVDIDPEMITDRPGPGFSLRRQDPDAAGEREIALSLAFRERFEQRGRAQEDARVEGVEIGDVLPDGGDPPGLVADPGHVVEIDVGMALDPRVHGLG